MTRYVVDASVAVEYLLKTDLGKHLAPVMDRAYLAAPELMDAEVLSALRRAVLKGRLKESRAHLAVEDLVTWPVERISHRTLARLAWEHRHNLSAYDAPLRGRRPALRDASSDGGRPPVPALPVSAFQFTICNSADLVRLQTSE